MRTQIHNPSRRGATSAEFALVLPFVIIIFMGIVEFSTMFYSWMTLQKAAQSAARFAATGQGEEEGTRLSQISQIAENWLEDLDNGSKEITISSWPTAAVSGDGATGNAGGPCGVVEVAVVYNYHPYTPIISAMLPEVVDLYGKDRKLNEPWKPCDD